MVKFWNKDVLRGMGVVLVSVVMSIISPFVVYASKLSEREMTMFSQNDIMFYDPKGSLGNIVCGPTTGSYDGERSAGLGDRNSNFVDTYHDIAEQLSIEYGIPWETVIAQGILESGAGTSPFARERNNFFGIGAFDSNPDNAYRYENELEGWRGYYENIRKTATYRNHGVFSGDTITDPYAYARAITEAGYATPQYADYLEPLIAAVQNRAQEKGWKSSAELAAEHPEMITNAGQNATGGGESSGIGEAGVSNMECPVGNGSINDTALQLAWPDGGHDPKDPKPEYREALAEVGLDQYPDPKHNVQDGNSCDAFVATVMRVSGADPDFVCCGAMEILKYLEGSDKYEEIENTGSTENLQAGDIRAKASHVELVVQLDDGSFRIASASNPDRTADYNINFYPDSEYRIFRRI